MQPDETDEERKEQLAQDIERPFTPADNGSSLQDDSTLPTTDTGVDSTELYQQGVDHPDKSTNGVAGYDPEKDQRQ